MKVLFATLALCLTALLALAQSPGTSPASQPAGHPFVCADYGGNKVCLVSAEGKVTWQCAAPAAQDVWMLPNGNVLFTHVRGIKEVNPKDDKVVWEYKSPEGTEIHNCQPLPDGRVLTAECGSLRVMEINRDGTIHKEFKVQTTVKAVHPQIRGARKLPDGRYVVGFSGEQVVRVYDAEGKVVRTINPPGGAYEVTLLPNGNFLAATGDGHTLVEIDPQDKIVWQIKENDLPGNPLRFVAGVQRLPNGNTVVCNWGGHGHVGKQPQIFEVTPDKKVVWQVHDDKQFKTISHVQILDVPGDATKGEILR